ncbi:MAG: proline--tRNA ligase [Clostridia bacterium]
MRKIKVKNMSSLVIKTLREAPADAELASHKLLVRAGMMKQLASGLYSYLPLLYRVLRKIEQIMREEMDEIGGQEINMPVVHSADLWKESGRYFEDVDEMLKFKDRKDRDMVLAMTHEEVVTDIVRSSIDSYKQLPFMLYHIQTKFRDEARSRGGLIRVREFVMKDGYSFHQNKEGLDEYYEEVAQAYRNIYTRSGLEDAVMVAGDSGMMGGNESHEFMHVTSFGEDRLAICTNCNYAANIEVALEEKQSVNENEEMKELEEVFTPNCKEISDVANFLNVKEAETLKTLIYKCENELILVCLRGDSHLSESKLSKILKTEKFRPASEEEIKTEALTAGFVSPVNNENYKIIVDKACVNSKNLVAGGNKKDYHIKNVNYDRDYKADLVGDITEVKDGSTCINCGGHLKVTRGIEIGNIFKLGTKYSESMGAYFTDSEGNTNPFIMGCYGIGVGRLAASVVEKYNDENGIIWPVNIAPYHVVVMPIGNPDSEPFKVAREIAEGIADVGIEVLFDDRDLRTGVKFNDLDLLGIPLRVVIGNRSIKNNQVEMKWRKDDQPFNIEIDQAVNWIKENINFDVYI